MTDEQPTCSRPRMRILGRLLALALLIAGASVWAARSGLGIGDLQALLRQHPAAPLLFLALHAVSSLLFLPRTALAMVAGLAFGLWWGLVWAALGSLFGALGGFLLARYAGGGLLAGGERTRFDPVLRRVEEGGWRAVAMLRLIPAIPHSAVNYLLGLTRLPLGAYALGSLVGQLPMTIAFVQFGAAGNQMANGRPDWIQPTAVGLAVLVLSLALPKLASRLGPQRLVP